MIRENLIVDENFCTACGACLNVCNVSAISMVNSKNGLRVARFNPEKCVQCNKCLKTCQLKTHNSTTVLEKYDGAGSTAYYGYALDHNDRYQAATAGITTTLIRELLDKKSIDAALMVRQGEDSAIEVEFVEDGADVSRFRGSIYRQVVLLENYLEKIRGKNYRSIAVVGLPCHIAAVKSLHHNIRSIANIELTTISVFCKKVKDERFSNFIRRQLGVKNNNATVQFKGDGWPGVTKCETRKMPSSNFKVNLMWPMYTYTPAYCFLCGDGLGLIADVSVGDAWDPEYMGKDKVGSSFFIANSVRGKEIISQASDLIYKEEIPFQRVYKSQGIGAIRSKHKMRKEITSVEQLMKTSAYKQKVMTERLYNKRWLIDRTPDLLLKVFAKALRSFYR